MKRFCGKRSEGTGRKKFGTVVTVCLLAALLLAAAGCGKEKEETKPKPKENSLTGVWQYTDPENGTEVVYDLKEDGTGTYSLKVEGETVVYELKYEARDGHFLIRYVNNEVFSEDTVFDSEYSWKDAETLVILDSFGQEMDFLKK